MKSKILSLFRVQILICSWAKMSYITGSFQVVTLQNHLLPTHQVSSTYNLSWMYKVVSRQLQGQRIHVPGSVSLYGLCPTLLLVKPKRYRGLPQISKENTVPYGHQKSGILKYFGQCQLNPELAHICRLCS